VDEPAMAARRVSVVIPCFNGGAFLEGALASLRAQTYRDFEIIVVDDGSDDAETLRVLDGLGPEARLVRQDNLGLPAARNAGIAAAAGVLVLPLDCDDGIEPEFLERTVAALDADPDAGFAFSHLRLIGERQGVLAKDYNFFTQLFLNQLPYCLLMHKQTWDRLGGYDETMRRGYEDWEFNIRAGANGLFGICVPEALFRYRVSDAGMLKSISNRLHAELWRDIQGRNPGLYRPRALIACWRQWRHRPMAYPAWLLAGLWAAHRVLPGIAFNRIYAALSRFSASARVPAGEGP
jgi:glycosyltransferase involved in cell wall biosynthesis